MLALLLLALACAGSRQPDTASDSSTGESDEETLKRLPLEAYLPSPGLSWAVALRPNALHADVDWQRALTPIVEAERFSAFEARLGFEAMAVETTWLAGYGSGALALVDGRQVEATMVESFVAHARSTGEVATGFDALTHLTAVQADEPMALVVLQDHLVATVQRDISLARMVRALVDGSLSPKRGALTGGVLTRLADFERDALVRAFAIGPFPDAESPLVALTEIAALALRLEGNRLFVTVRVLGAWQPPDTATLEVAMQEELAGLLKARELSALGWSEPLESPTVRCRAEDDCLIQGVWSAGRVVEGLRLVTQAELDELLK